MSDNSKTGRMLSPQARKAAIETRRLRLAAQPARNAAAVFIVRLGAGQDLGFGWEIRKFGSFVLLKSNEGFTTRSEAQVAGEKALATMKPT